jgi:glycerol-3-phosphate cytidylyltransferase
MGVDKMAGTTVYTYVVADLFHIGHLKLLQNSKALGDKLVVGVLNNNAVWAYKRLPVIPFEQRMEIVANLKCVDEVMEQTDVDPTENILIVRPDITTHAHKEDEPPAHWQKAVEAMEYLGGEAVRLDYCNLISTSEIISKIRVRSWARAHTLMPKGGKLEKITIERT